MLNIPVQNADAADLARTSRYATLAAFADGDQWLGRRPRVDTRLTVNYARALTRKVASYVFAGPIRFSVIAAHSQSDAAARAETILATAIRDNDLDALDLDLCISASVLGDAAVKVTWDATRGVPVVAAVHPGALTVLTPPGNPRQAMVVSHRYTVDREIAAAMLGKSIPGGRSGQPVCITEKWDQFRWTVWADEHQMQDDPNPYGWIPYVVCANNQRADQFWGESDLIDLIDICRELNSRMSVLSRVLEISGAPITVLENVEGSEAIQVGPGATWEIPENSRAYLLDLLQGGGVRLHIDYIDLLYRTLHDLSETPRTAFGDSGRALSGAALEVEIQPLVQKVNRKRQTWSAFHRARNFRLLDLLERFGGYDIDGLRETETVWPGILPSDIDGSVRNAVSLVQSGIQSRRTAFAGLGGLDPDTEQLRIQEEEAARS